MKASQEAEPYTKAGPVTITYADGTTETRPALTKNQLKRHLDERGRKPIHPAFRAQIYERDGGRCRYCRTDQGPFEVDHVVPIAMGGSTRKDNLVTACVACNNRKGAKVWTPLPLEPDRPPADWLAEAAKFYRSIRQRPDPNRRKRYRKSGSTRRRERAARLESLECEPGDATAHADPGNRTHEQHPPANTGEIHGSEPPPTGGQNLTGQQSA